MKRLVPFMPILVAMTLPSFVSAQTSGTYGNNPTTQGLYVEGMLGLNLLSDIDFDVEGLADDATSKYETGVFGAAAVGYNLPTGPFNVRVEGELSFRGNALDEFEFANGDEEDGDDDSVTSAIAGMVNAHLDYYVLPNLAASAGVGVGYANVEVDVVTEVGNAENEVIDDEDDSAFAYQLRLGSRYDLGSHSTITAGYTYFATGDLELEDVVNNEASYNYDSHAFHAGYAYRF